ncbi:MAG: hypothetical protein M0R32_09145 [Candidatus Cloacimonetes bacterium]|jgi:hypothetical protein|nr:hypothetical protein [Candidatus Cloacimonadota bacterium]
MKQGITIKETGSKFHGTRWVAGFPYGMKVKEEKIFCTLFEIIEWAKKTPDFPITFEVTK